MIDAISAALCSLGHTVDLGHGQRQRLLTEHVLARLECSNRPLRVQVVGQGKVDRIDFVGADEFLVTSEGHWNPTYSRIGLRTLGSTRAHRHQRRPIGAAHRVDYAIIDPGGAQQAPAQHNSPFLTTSL